MNAVIRYSGTNPVRGLPEWYVATRQGINAGCSDSSKITMRSSSVSPSQKYRLITSYYEQHDLEKRYSCGTLYDDSGGIIASINRDDDNFWNAWISIGDKQEYLLCGESAVSQTVIDCTSRECFLHIDTTPRQTIYWHSVHPNPCDPTILAVEGKYSNSAWRIAFFKFITPEHPFVLIGVIQDWYSEFKGWYSSDTVLIARDYEVRRSDGKLIEALSEAEQQELHTRRSTWMGMKPEDSKVLFPNREDLLIYLDTDTRQDFEYWNVPRKLGISITS